MSCYGGTQDMYVCNNPFSRPVFVGPITWQAVETTELQLFNYVTMHFIVFELCSNLFNTHYVSYLSYFD